MSTTLRLLNGPLAGAKVPVAGPRAVVGTDIGCDVVLDDPLVAAQHAAIEWASGAWTVTDLSGETGTFVNGARLTAPRALRRGDSLRLGRTILVFECAAEPATEPVAAPAAGSDAEATSDVWSEPTSAPVPAPRVESVETTAAVAVAAPAAATAVAELPEPAAAAAARRTASVPVLDGCVPLEEIAQTSTGTVYRSRQIVHARDIAVRVLDVDFDRKALADRLVQHAGLPPHANVLRVHEVTALRGVPYAIVEFGTGGSLADRVSRGGAIPWREGIRLVSQIAAGLGHFHERGLVHGAVRPSRVFLGRTGQVKLGDAGPLVRHAGATDCAFLAPEVAAGAPATAASDIWSLGATVYYALSGKKPDRGAPTPLCEICPALPAKVGEIVDSTLVAEPSARPASAATIGRHLVGVILLADAQKEAAKPGRKKAGLREGTLAALGIAAAAAVFWWIVKDGFGTEEPEEETAGAVTKKSSRAKQSAAMKRYLAIRAKEQGLGMLTATNLDALRRVSDEYRDVGRTFSIDDDAVGLSWQRRRELLRSVSAAAPEPDEASRIQADLWMTKALDGSGPAPRGAKPSADAAVLRTSREAAFAAAETSLDAGRVSEGLGSVAAWVLSARSSTAAGDESAAEVKKATDWLRTTATGAAARLRADVQVDGEILIAHLTETSCFGGPRDAVAAPDFPRAAARLDRVEALVTTEPGQARIAGRRAALQLEAEAYRTAPLAASEDETARGTVHWREQVAKTLAAALPGLTSDCRAGALRLICETGDGARAAKALDRAESLGGVDPAVRAECRAVAALAVARAADSSKRAEALAAWAEEHAATDASLVLCAFPGCEAAAGAHPGIVRAEARRYCERWGMAAAPAPSPAK